MAKKSRKARARVRTADTTRQPGAVPEQQKAQAAPVKSQPAVAAVSVQPQNYSYVKSDLLRVAVIAGAMLLILVVLTFVPALK